MPLKIKLGPSGEQLAQKAVNVLFALIPRALPTLPQVEAVQIVAHRGSNLFEIENTLRAFDHAVLHKVDAIEFDVRWTSDECAVIGHDESCERLFSVPLKISEVTSRDLRAKLPLIPTLEEVIQRYTGPKRIQGSSQAPTHLMIELKTSSLVPSPCPALSTAAALSTSGKTTSHGFSNDRLLKLAQLLKSLRPGEDYHLMCLDPEGLHFIEASGIFPPRALLSIALTNTNAISRRTLETSWAGFTGHYLLITDSIRDQHKARQQSIGVGFVESMNGLKREIGRGVKWIFSNNATQVAAWRDDLRQELQNRLKNGPGLKR